MKTSYLIYSIFSVLVCVGAANVAAQETRPAEAPPQTTQRPDGGRPGDPRLNLLHRLGLSAEQVEQIRRINVERKPLMDEAQRHLREANRALDAAIYADQVNETDVDARIKDVQTAQTEVARIRFTNELAVRRVLTPEQLIRFREMRQRFEQARKDLRNRRTPDGSRLLKRRMPGGGAQPESLPGPQYLPSDPQTRDF